MDGLGQRDGGVTLPRLAKLIVGQGIWDRFVVELPDGEVEYSEDLAFYSDAGVQVVLATSEDWPPQAIIAVDDIGRYHSLQE